MRFAYALFAVLVCSTVHAQKIDAMLKPPPPPADVFVLNWPETQAVEGSVAVTNLPAVQTVAGTVTCIGAGVTSPHSVTYDLLDTQVHLQHWSNAVWNSTWVESGEWSQVTVVVAQNSYSDCYVEFRYSPLDSAGWVMGPFVSRGYAGVTGPVVGPELRVVCTNGYDFDGEIYDVRVFLRK